MVNRKKKCIDHDFKSEWGGKSGNRSISTHLGKVCRSIRILRKNLSCSVLLELNIF